MGGCVGTNRNGSRGSRRPSGFSDSTSSGLGHPGQHKNRPLRHEKIRWKSDIPLTDGQLKSKRDEFWDTAPAFEGKVEIWNALKAAAEAAEADDFDLAQAILDGAGISLPNGSLVNRFKMHVIFRSFLENLQNTINMFDFCQSIKFLFIKGGFTVLLILNYKKKL